MENETYTTDRSRTRSLRMCLRCMRAIPDGPSRCVCFAIKEIQEHLPLMLDDYRMQVLYETFAGYCTECGRKLRLRRDLSGEEIAGSWGECHCTNDE